MDAHEQIKQYVDVAWRRRWWVVVPTVIGLAVAIYLSRSLPKVYRASTTILAIRQSVPQDIAPSTAAMQPEERMKSLKIQVFSRQYLEKVAREFKLVEPGDSEAKIERVCKRLANGQIDIEWDRQSLSWFKIIVDDGDPSRAAGMANRLADLFIQQNTALREQEARGLVETVENWSKDYEAQLAERDRKIAQFRKDHLYELPDQQEATIQLLNASQARIAQLTSDIEMRTQRLATLRAEEVARQAAATTGAATPVTSDPDTAALAQLQRDLRDLLVSYTEENPLVKRKREQIAQFKAAHPALTAAQSLGGEGGTITSPEIARIQGEIAALDADRTQEQRRADDYKKRIENMPKIQEQLADLTRDYETKKRQYESSVGQLDQAKRAQDIQDAKKGEQFEIQDRARPPAVPFKPQVLQLLVVGLLAGLGLGAGLAVLLEFLDHTVTNEDEFARSYPEIPVLGAIPNLDRETRSRKRHHRHHHHPGVESVAGAVAVAVSAATLGSLLGGILG